MSGIDYFQGHIRRERVPFISRLCSGRSRENVDLSAIKSNKKLLSPFRLTKAQTLLLKCMKRKRPIVPIEMCIFLQLKYLNDRLPYLNFSYFSTFFATTLPLIYCYNNINY